MARYPDVQRRAQADVDNVAPNRLPTLDDYDSLPYIRAMIKEIIRWAPVAPLGLNHAVLEDDVYENYFIPKGTRIIVNIWYTPQLYQIFVADSLDLGLSHTMKNYTRTPLLSIPVAIWVKSLRLIHSSSYSGLGGESVLVISLPIFRNDCFTYMATIKGAYLAEMSLFLNICNILSVFDISKPVDINGAKVEPEEKWTTGITTCVALSEL